MKVAIINLKSLDHMGGAEVWSKEICHLLQDNGIEAIIFYPTVNKNNKVDSKCSHIEVRPLLFRIFSKFGIINLYPPFLNMDMPDDIEVVYITTVYPFLLYHKLLSRGKRVIVGSHDLFTSNTRFGIDTIQLFTLFLLRLISNNKNLMAHSLNSATSEKLKRSRLKVMEIGNEFLVLGKSPDFLEPIEKLGKGHKFKVLFLGNIEIRKGSHFLPGIIDAFSRREDMEFTFAGKIIDRALKKRLHNMKVLPAFVGQVSEDKKDILFREADLFLFLSEREASPIVLEEAFSRGGPVISTWKGIEFMYSARYGLYKIVGRDIGSIVNAIIEFKKVWEADMPDYGLKKHQRSLNYHEFYDTIPYRDMIKEMFTGSADHLIKDDTLVTDNSAK